MSADAVESNSLEEIIPGRIRIIRAVLNLDQKEFGVALRNPKSRITVMFWETERPKSERQKKVMPSDESLDDICDLIGLEKSVLLNEMLDETEFYEILIDTIQKNAEKLGVAEKQAVSPSEQLDDLIWWKKVQAHIEAETGKTSPEDIVSLFIENPKKYMGLDPETKEALNDKEVQQRIVHTKIKPSGKHISLNLSDHLKARDTTRDERRILAKQAAAYIHKKKAGHTIKGGEYQSWKNTGIASLIKDEDLNSTKMMQGYIDARTKREVDPIGKYKKIVSDKIIRSGAQQSYDFWAAVNYELNRHFDEQSVFYGAVIDSGHEQQYDWLAADSLDIGRFCTLHSRKEADLLKMEVQKCIGDLFITEKMLDKKYDKYLFIYDREGDTGKATTMWEQPSWLTSLCRASGVELVKFYNKDMAVNWFKNNHKAL